MLTQLNTQYRCHRRRHMGPFVMFYFSRRIKNTSLYFNCKSAANLSVFSNESSPVNSLKCCLGNKSGPNSNSYIYPFTPLSAASFVFGFTFDCRLWRAFDWRWPRPGSFRREHWLPASTLRSQVSGGKHIDSPDESVCLKNRNPGNTPWITYYMRSNHPS